jgi:hypothetical protein
MSMSLPLGFIKVYFKIKEIKKKMTKILGTEL